MRGSVLAGGCWGGLLLLARLGAGDGGGVLDPGYLVMCVLLVAAPMCLALPAGRALGAPAWALETVLAWAVVGYLLLFVDPRDLGRGLALLLFLPALCGALASPALWWAARRGGGRRLRARGYLLALLPGGALLLNALGALTPLDAALLVLLVVSAQGLLLTARRPVPAPPPEPALAASVVPGGD